MSPALTAEQQVIRGSVVLMVLICVVFHITVAQAKMCPSMFHLFVLTLEKQSFNGNMIEILQLCYCPCIFTKKIARLLQFSQEDYFTKKVRNCELSHPGHI